LQAAVLNIKLRYVDEDNNKRRKIAEKYIHQIKNDEIVLPKLPNNPMEHVWHLFVIRSRQRDKLQHFLSENGIQTLIHYPIPPHKQEAYRELNHLTFPVTEQIHKEVLSLPISPILSDQEVMKVIECVNNFRN
jgi:dTDP-4-amino-4,6-dideoxygalactose transaminase